MLFGTYPVQMKRGGQLPMHVVYNAYYEHEPTGDGVVIEIESVNFSPKDQKDRGYLLAEGAEKLLQETLAGQEYSQARKSGWCPPRPYTLPYYR